MFTSSRRFRSSFIAHYSLPKNLFLMFLSLILLARFAWVKTSDAARRRPYVSSSHAYYHLVMLNLFQHLTASLFLSFSADRSWNELFAFAHRKHLIFFEWGMVRMTFVYSPLIAHRSSLIAHCVLMKIFYKTVFSYKSSWKVESAQLENFYFPVGKLFFLSWKIKISQ